jgi:HPt (histidine-containing phosphotransfer) domain-containing protein
MEHFAQTSTQSFAGHLQAGPDDAEGALNGLVGEALNESIYAKLAASMQRAQLLQLYELCLNDAEARIGTMRESAACGDDEGYRRAAHQIKGGCGMTGAIELQRLADRMEQQGLSAANHVASLDEFLLATERLRRILVAP